MKKRLLGGLAATMLLLGLLAPAAGAGVTGVAVLADQEGIADVGNEWLSERCSKTGGTATGQGLLIETSEDDPHTWSLDSDFTFVGTNANNETDEIEAGVWAGTFNACGWMMGTVPPLGASCLTTKGYEGVGQATALPLQPADNSPFRIKLFNIGWKAAVGPILPVTGNYQEYEGASGPAKKAKFGTIVALIGAAPTPIAPGALPCIAPTKATHFQIAGAAALINGGPIIDKSNDGPIWTKSCDDKDTPDECPTPKEPRPMR